MNVRAHLTAMGTQTQGSLRDHGEAEGIIRSSRLLVNHLEAFEIEQFGPEGELLLFAHGKSSLQREFLDARLSAASLSSHAEAGRISKVGAEPFFFF